jgi:hypothetical protein
MVSLMVLVLAGCTTTPPVKYYALDPYFELRGENSPAVVQSPLAIGVGPVEFPKMLDRHQIVTRKTRYQVDVSDYHRWASSFSEDFLRVLTRNIATLLPTDRVVAYPWADGFSPTCRLHLIVEQFDGRFGGDVVLKVAWSVRNQADQKAPVTKHARITEPIHGETYDELVAAQSRALGTLSRAIVDEIERIGCRDQ